MKNSKGDKKVTKILLTLYTNIMLYKMIKYYNDDNDLTIASCSIKTALNTVYFFDGSFQRIFYHGFYG